MVTGAPPHPRTRVSPNAPSAAPTAALAVDIGGTKAELRARAGAADSGVVRIEWDAPDRRRAPDFDDDIERLDAAAQRALRAVGATSPRTAVLALPATLDAEGRVSRWPGRPSWRGRRPAAELAARWNATPLVRDDALLAGYAEARAGHRTLGGLLYLGIGTGVGGAWLPPRPADAPPPGPDELRPCEAGHLVVRPDDGPLCVCGQHGCLQAYASGPALLRAAADRGRAAALAEAADACALAVAAIGELLPFATVVLGGGVGANRADLAAALSARLPHRTRRGSTLPAVAPAVHGTAGSLAGALLLARSAEPPQRTPAPHAPARRGGRDTAATTATTRTPETAEGDPST
ncbi:ROK family protein [Streptomyces californicus]|uniref:ROK family protein n=1 Tax=Streptomyces californicus TaxID=67351 RepID=UPI00368728CB